MKKDKTFRPDRVLSYFKAEWLPLAFVTLSGLVYNIGLLATPWFEGRLAQCLADILGGSETAAKMAMLVLAYIVVTLAVQAARFIKRFYVRRFANNINRRMKGILYANLVRQSRAALEKEGAGELMIKIILEQHGLSYTIENRQDSVCFKITLNSHNLKIGRASCRERV